MSGLVGGVKPRRSLSVAFAALRAHPAHQGLGRETSGGARPQGTRAKLENRNFVDKAPADVVQQQRELVTDLEGQIRALEANLAELKQA
jgi:TolA-binding protein